MMKTNLKTIIQLAYMFSIQSKGKRNYINIGKIIKQQEQSTSQTSSHTSPNLSQKAQFKTYPPQTTTFSQLQPHTFSPQDTTNDSQWASSQKQEHMSTEQQQMNQKIKGAIRCGTIYNECSKRKHKLEVRHYALMFCKILQLRRLNSGERKDVEDFGNFLSIIEKKLQQMPPQQLVRIIHGMKYQNASKQDLKLLSPIVQKIINQFSNTNATQLQPQSFQTLRLSTNIKLFHSLLFILQQTGSHFEKKLKVLMNETLNYILFKSMKTKKHSKTGEYFPLGLKISFLLSCKLINASSACIRNLILAILVERERLTLQNLLDVEAILFESPQVLQRTRKQLFSEKQIHIKYNILHRIQKYINQQIPTNLKKSTTYSLLTKKLIKHLSLVSQLSLQQLAVLEMTAAKDQQVYRILTLFHQGYKNYLIENYASINEKEDIIAFFNKSQNIEYSLYQLLLFFYNRLQKQGVNAIRPSVKKQLKEFVNLLSKFYNKLNFLTQSLIIKFLVMSNFTNLKPIITEFLQINTFTTASRKVQRTHFFTKDKSIMLQNFLNMIHYQQVFRQHCPMQYQLFINSNLKGILKFLLKSEELINVEKYASCLAEYCKTLPEDKVKAYVDVVVKSYLRVSVINRAFKKGDVDTIFKNKEYFLSTSLDSHQTQLQNQTDIFGSNVVQKEQKDSFQLQRLLPTLTSDKQVLRQHYELEQKIRRKLRMALKNFKFLMLFMENIKLNTPKQIHYKVIGEDIYVKLLENLKSQLQCLKFQRVFTKENCSDLMEINQFMGDIWQQTLSTVEVRNQSLMHKHQLDKEKEEKQEKMKEEKEEEKDENNEIKKQEQSIVDSKDQGKKTQKDQGRQTQKPLQVKNNEVKQSESTDKKPKQEMQILDQDEEQSQQSQYTEEVEYLKGKDILQLQTLKKYNLKQTKGQGYFREKNNKILHQIQQLTNYFTQLPPNITVSPQKLTLLKELSQYYSLNENIIGDNKKIIDLPTVDQSTRENLEEVLKVQIDNKENKQIYTMRIFTKLYPTLTHFAINKQGQSKLSDQNKPIPTVYYVNTSQVKKNYKKKSHETTHTNNQQAPLFKKQKQQNQQNNTKQSKQ